MPERLPGTVTLEDFSSTAETVLALASAEIERGGQLAEGIHLVVVDRVEDELTDAAGELDVVFELTRVIFQLDLAEDQHIAKVDEGILCFSEMRSSLNHGNILFSRFSVMLSLTNGYNTILDLTFAAYHAILICVIGF